MSDIPLSDDLGRRSGFPWYYPVVFLLNLALIIVLELLLFYRISLPLTEELLEKKDPAYAGSTIVNTTENYTMTWYLVQTDSGELQLVPAQRHDILRDRGRLRLDQAVTIPADTAYMEVQTRHGISAETVTVGTEVEPWNDDPQDFSIKLRSKYAYNSMSNSGKYSYTLMFFLALALSILESVIWNKIRNG